MRKVVEQKTEERWVPDYTIKCPHGQVVDTQPCNKCYPDFSWMDGPLTDAELEETIEWLGDDKHQIYWLPARRSPHQKPEEAYGAYFAQSPYSFSLRRKFVEWLKVAQAHLKKAG